LGDLVRAVVVALTILTFLTTCFLLLLGRLTRGRRFLSLITYTCGTCLLFVSLLNLLIDSFWLLVLAAILLVMTMFFNSEAGVIESG